MEMTTRGQNAASGQITLGYFIARLAETLVLGEQGLPCNLCAIGGCDSQVSGMTCLNGVASWLTEQAGQYDSDAEENEEAYLSYLSLLPETRLPDAGSLLERRFPHFKMNVFGARMVYDEWRARKERGLL
jgi:hypothetical protein